MDYADRVRSHRPGVAFIFVTLLLDVLGFGLIIPVAPKLVMSLTGGTEGEAATYVGLLAASYALMQFVCAPILGVLSDRFGRRPVLLVSIFGSGLDYFAMALAPSVAWLFVTRLINGISGASMTVATAYIADITPEEKRAGAFGLIGAAFGLGFVIGPLLGGLLGQIDIHYPFYAAGAVTLLNWLYGLIVLPESLPADRRRPVRIGRMNPVGAYAGLVRYPLVLGLASALFLLNVAMFALHSTWVLYTGHRYGWGPLQVGLSLFAVGLTAAVVQGFLARKIVPRMGEGRAAIAGIAIGILAYLGYGFATEGWMIYAVIALASLGGIAGPAMQSLIARAVDPTERGTIQGALTSLQSLANIAGPLVGTAVFAYAIAPEPGGLGDRVPGLSFFVCAALAALGWVVALAVIKRFHAGALGQTRRVDPQQAR